MPNLLQTLTADKYFLPSTNSLNFLQLLDGEIYHYHTKLLMKEPRTGGKFLWHQDYGYWYNNGVLFPDMGTVWVAIDKTDEENGSLKVN